MKKEYIFKKNRFCKDELVQATAALDNLDMLEKMIVVTIQDERIEVNLEGSKDYSVDDIKDVFYNLDIFDNIVQDFCEECYKQGNYGYKAYTVELAWLALKDDRVILRYWGEHVNIELEASFIKENSNWKLDEIFYR